MGAEGDTFSVLPGTPGSVVAALQINIRKERLVARGRLGKKSGRGFYDW